MNMFMCEYTYTFIQVLWRLEKEGVRSPRAGVIGGCDLPDVGAGSLQEQQTLLIPLPTLRDQGSTFFLKK